MSSETLGLPTAPRTPFTLRAILLAIVFGVLGIAWVVQISLIRPSVLLGGSVPPVPAVAVLLLLAAVNPLLKRYGLAQGEILLIAIFVGIATAIADPNCLLNYFFAFLILARYAPAPQTDFVRLTETLPSWFVPSDQDALRGFALGRAPIPWAVWALPLLGWGVFFCAMWLTSYAVLSLFRERWTVQEKLRFPIVDLMVDLTPESASAPSFLKNRLLWFGIGVSAVFNLLNILNAFDSNIPATGRLIDLGGMFVESPWRALSPMWISLRPEIFGIGYLMNRDVLFTAWFSYLLLRLSSVTAVTLGYEVESGYYDYQEIAAGAYLMVFFSLVWLGRRSIASLVPQIEEVLAFYPPGHPRAARAQRNRLLTVLILIGFGYQLWWVTTAGLTLWIGVLYLGLLLIFAIVYSRIRAETGAPIWYVLPFWQQHKVLINFFGTSTLGAGGDASLAVLATLGFLARGTYPQLAAFQIESMEVTERAAIRPRHMTACVLSALPFGLVVGGLFVLHYAYQKGFYSIDGSTGTGGFRVLMASLQYKELAQWQSQPTGPNLQKILFTLLGGVLVAGMGALRGVFPGSPFHPLGFAMAASYGFHLWAPFLAMWVLKAFILQAGGVKLYRQYIPFFLGIVVGHYLVAGIVWGGLALVVPDLTQNFIIHFS